MDEARRDLERLGGTWIPASVYLPKKTGWAGFVLRVSLPLGKAPGSILPRLFILYSVTFLFYFTLIMIIQEYYLSDKFRVSFLIYNFLLRWFL